MIILFLLLALAVVQDIYSGKVSNKLILLGLVFGFSYKIWDYGASGIYYFLRNISVPVVMFYLLFLMHVLGAGDIKLFSMIGGILTIEELFSCIWYSLMIGGGISLVYLFVDKNRVAKLRCACIYLLDLAKNQKIVPYKLPEEIPKKRMAFSAAIFLGFICMYGISLIE